MNDIVKYPLLLALVLILNDLVLNDVTAQGQSPEEIFSKISDAVVVILAYDFDGNLRSQGSGVVINDKGFVVTNYHVFADCERLEIMHKDRLISYNDIIGVDIDKDILILKIADNAFPSIPIGNSDNVRVGQRIYAIGSPMGLENSISEGLVSGIRNLDFKNKNFIQISASMSPGSSGGAVVNSEGELIGISTMSLIGGQNLNFAIPINDVLNIKLGSYNNKESIEYNGYYYKGVNAYNSGSYSKAVEYLLKYLSVYKGSITGHLYLGMSYHRLRNYDYAMEYYNRALELDPNEPSGYIDRGALSNDLGDYYEAIEDFSKAIELNSKLAFAYNNRGVSYDKLGQYEKALRDYSKAIELKPDYAHAFYNMALIYVKVENMIKAVENFKKAAQFGDVDAQNWLRRNGYD